MKHTHRIPLALLLTATLAAAPRILAQTADSSQHTPAAYGTVTGIVLDDDSRPLQGATVRIVGTTFGAKSRTNGSFIIAGVPPGDYEITATYVGFQPYRQTITAGAGMKDSLEIKLTTKPLPHLRFEGCIFNRGDRPEPERPGTVHIIRFDP